VFAVGVTWAGALLAGVQDPALTMAIKFSPSTNVFAVPSGMSLIRARGTPRTPVVMQNPRLM